VAVTLVAAGCLTTCLPRRHDPAVHRAIRGRHAPEGIARLTGSGRAEASFAWINALPIFAAQAGLPLSSERSPSW